MSVIELNVGGTPYVTTKETLCRFKGTMLESMFNGTFNSTKIGSAYFIDRDGKIFHYILQFLRDGDSWEPPTDRDRIMEILREARFFCIEPLIRRLEASVSTDPSKNNSTAILMIMSDSMGRHWVSSDFSKGTDGYLYKSGLDDALKEAYSKGYRLASHQASPWSMDRFILFLER